MLKLIFILPIIAIFIGCSASKPAITEYKIATIRLQSNTLSTECRDKSLKVSQAFSSSSLMSLAMKYMQDDYKIYEYSQAQWYDSPNQEISLQVVKIIRESKLFKSTQSSKSRSRSDMILEIDIEDFMQYFSKELDKSYSKVVINLTMIDSKTSRVVASRRFTAKSKISTHDASGGVKALDDSLEDVLKQSVEFLNEVCK